MKLFLYLTSFLYFFIPFQFALSPANNFDVAIIRLLIIGIALLYFAYALKQKTLFIPKGWIIGFLAAFLMWILFSLFFTPVPEWTARKIFFLLSIAPIVLVLTNLFRTTPLAKIKLVQVTVLGGFFVALIGIIQFILQFILSLDTLLILWTKLTPFFLGDTFSESVIMHNSWLVNIAGTDLMRAVAFFPDPHIFSFYLGLIMPLSLGIFFTTKHKFWIVGFIIMLLADFLTFSRGGYIGIFAGLLLGIILLWPYIKTNIRHFIILLSITFIFILFIPNNPITNRFVSSFDHTDTSNSHRIELWSNAVTQISESPILGTGLGAYAYIVNPRTDYRTPFYVHNLALDITVELGIIGLILFFGIFVSLLIIFYKHRSNFISLFSIISISIFLIHSIFDTPIFSVHIFPILLLFIALGISFENIKIKF